MPGKVRIEFPGAKYHVMSRGDRREDLEVLAYSAPEKVVLAWWLRKQTTVSLQWASERLKMGHYTRVTQAVSRMRRKPNKPLRTIARKLSNATE
jgi:hypothetical protein